MNNFISARDVEKNLQDMKWSQKLNRAKYGE